MQLGNRLLLLLLLLMLVLNHLLLLLLMQKLMWIEPIWMCVLIGLLVKQLLLLVLLSRMRWHNISIDVSIHTCGWNCVVHHKSNALVFSLLRISLTNHSTKCPFNISK